MVDFRVILDVSRRLRLRRRLQYRWQGRAWPLKPRRGSGGRRLAIRRDDHLARDDLDGGPVVAPQPEAPPRGRSASAIASAGRRGGCCGRPAAPRCCPGRRGEQRPQPGADCLARSLTAAVNDPRQRRDRRFEVRESHLIDPLPRRPRGLRSRGCAMPPRRRYRARVLTRCLRH